ncbi:hypothetical protein KUCAC02_031102 [Chaenocephalus aceratus]|uniref:Uncharacterized protein n=1 Tax=Chaenocephalus aceratus TaxID=36190 RepID=A0ACB9XMW2_CHAAC|nr:hypothetical protein KUCAC02_031102 [Chaenocephalus aceratus]
MTDDPFLYPDTWWASGAGPTEQEQQDEIRLDLESHFCMSHIVWSRLFVAHPVYTSPTPCGGGEVILRTLDPFSANNSGPLQSGGPRPPDPH